MFDVVSDLSATERIAVLEAAHECTTQEELSMHVCNTGDLVMLLISSLMVMTIPTHLKINNLIVTIAWSLVPVR